MPNEPVLLANTAQGIVTNALRDAGVAILLESVELSEILSLSDRIIVMCDGRITGERTPETTHERDLGLLMAGVKDHAA